MIFERVLSKRKTAPIPTSEIPVFGFSLIEYWAVLNARERFLCHFSTEHTYIVIIFHDLFSPLKVIVAFLQDSIQVDFLLDSQDRSEAPNTKICHSAFDWSNPSRVADKYTTTQSRRMHMQSMFLEETINRFDNLNFEMRNWWNFPTPFIVERIWIQVKLWNVFRRMKLRDEFVTYFTYTNFDR